jgi:hypothetical protein
MGLRDGGRGHYTLGVGEMKNGHPARCVVWVDGPGGVPSALERVLVSRGMEPVRVGSGHGALAELCVAERAGSRSALILCGVGEADRVLGAVERFAPSAVVWVFEAGANPPLRALVVQAVKKEEKAEPARGAAERTNGAAGASGVETDPLMRLVRENGLKNDRPAADPVRRERAVSARDILDDAELEMLLAGERPMEEHPR